MKLVNRTKQRQEVLLINGDSIKLPPNGECEVDDSLLYEFEKERLSKICFIETSKNKKEVTKPSEKEEEQEEDSPRRDRSRSRKNEENEDGGNE